MARLMISLIGLAAVVAFVAPSQAGSVLNVDDDAPPGGDGTSWDTAYRFLQDALTDASGGDVTEIRVAQGTYLPDRDEANPSGTGDREATFQLISGVALMGGYAGFGTPDPDARDIDLYETILSGDLLGNDGLDFANNDENSYTVVTGSATDATAVLEGFSITAGNADCPWEPGDPLLPCYLGGGMFNQNASLMATNCTFAWNSARFGGGIYNVTSSLTISNCMFSHNFAEISGGGVRNNQSSGMMLSACTFSANWGGSGGGGGIANRQSTVTVVGCTFSGNSAEGGGAMASQGPGSISVTGCAFIANSAGVGGAIVNSIAGLATTLQSCTFTHNEAELVAGGLSAGGSSTILINCAFIRNSSAWIMGGMLDQTDATLVNCIFSRNTGDWAGGLYSASDSTLINCTLSGNLGGGMTLLGPINPTLTNCVLWGNTPHQIAEDPSDPSGIATVTYSDIEGGWTGPGSNNIDADPLFVQPGFDNVRLSFGSPCVNAGSNAALPPDEFDLDGDGNTTEPLPVDLDGNDRIQDGIVDMGAYEGEHEPLPPGSGDGEEDVDQGETAFLVPTGGPFNPLESAAVIFTNVSGPDNAWVTVAEWYDSMHPGAGGYSDLTVNVTIETSLADGQFFAIVFIPFDASDLNGADPLRPNLTYFDPALGNWALAVAGNTADSPGFNGPIGNRVTVQGSGGLGVTDDLGDYGVFWNPTLQQGLVWANIDHAADLALGVALCPPDCRQTPDGVVDVLDLLTLLAAWGDAAGDGPCDLDFDGTVGIADVLALLDAWGPCTQPAQGPLGVRRALAFGSITGTLQPGPAEKPDKARMTSGVLLRSADLDGDRSVGRRDLLILRSAWGPNPGHSADFNRDGIVDALDLAILLANWG